MPEVIGRGGELHQLEGLVRGSRATCIVLDGDPGIGKTTVWTAAVEACRSHGDLVLVSAPAEAETRLSYVGLTDLLAGTFDEVRPDLPAPQARALAIAMQLEEAGERGLDETALARGLLATLRLLARRHERLVLAIDDLRWLDGPTLAAVSFAVRRLGPADRVTLLTTHRLGASEPAFLRLDDAVERIHLGPLSLGGISRILRLQIGQSLSRPRLLELYAASAGNPLHAVELARAQQPGAVGGDGSVTALVRARLATLPSRTRQALLLLAASSNRAVPRLSRAWGHDLMGSLRPAIEAGVVMVTPEGLRPAHPLFARLAYDEAAEEQRRAAHRSLAATAITAEERAAHLGRSVDWPEPEIARRVEEAAIETRRRGVRSVSATLFDRSAELTPPEATDDRARRALAAASAWFEAGDLNLARARFEALIVQMPSGTPRAEARLRLGIVLHEAGRWGDAMTAFDRALTETDEPKLVAEILRRIAISAGFTTSVPERTAHAQAALAAAEAAGDAETLTYCLATLALAHVMAGAPRRVPESLLDRAFGLEAGLDHALTGWTPRLVDAELARLSLDLERARHLYAAVTEQAEVAGDATLEHWASYGMGSTELAAGDYMSAGRLAEQTIELAETTGILDLYGRRLLAQVDAHLGLTTEARELSLAVLAAAEASGGRLHAMAAHTVLGQLALASGDPTAAARSLRAARQIAIEMGFWNGVTVRAMLDEAEAAAAAGLTDQAREVLDVVGGRFGSEPPEWLNPLVDRCEGLLLAARGKSAEAERQLARSAEALRNSQAPLERARALLLLGTVRRRARHDRGARDALAESIAIFERLGAVLWARRAHDELDRIPGRRRSETNGLTASEGRVAALVARGRSNREVAAELFLSVKTVEVTLTRVYEKVGVRSRAELAARFPSYVEDTSKQ